MRVDGRELCSCTASNGGATLSTKPVQCIVFWRKWFPRVLQSQTHQARPANQQGPARPRKPCRMDSPTLPDPFPEQLTHGRQKRHPCPLNFILQHPIPCKWWVGSQPCPHGSRRPTNKRGKFGCQTARLLTVFWPLTWKTKKTITDWTWPLPGLTVCSAPPGLERPGWLVSIVASLSPE